MSQRPPDYQAIPMCAKCHSRDHTTYSQEEKQLVTEAVAVLVVEYFTGEDF
jgi:cytochrome c553